MRFYIDPLILYGTGFLNKETSKKRNVYSLKTKKTKEVIEDLLKSYIGILDTYFSNYNQYVEDTDSEKDRKMFFKIYLAIFNNLDHYTKLMLSAFYMAITTKYNEIQEEVKTVVWYNVCKVNLNDILHKTFVRFTYYTLNDLVNDNILKLNVDGICLTDFFFNYIYINGDIGRSNDVEFKEKELEEDEQSYIEDLKKEVREIHNHFLSCSNKSKITLVHLREHPVLNSDRLMELYFVAD